MAFNLSNFPKARPDNLDGSLGRDVLHSGCMPCGYLAATADARNSVVTMLT